MFVVIIELEKPNGERYYQGMVDVDDPNTLVIFPSKGAIRDLKEKHPLGKVSWIAVSTTQYAAQEIL